MNFHQWPVLGIVCAKLSNYWWLHKIKDHLSHQNNQYLTKRLNQKCAMSNCATSMVNACITISQGDIIASVPIRKQEWIVLSEMPPSCKWSETLLSKMLYFSSNIKSLLLRDCFCHHKIASIFETYSLLQWVTLMITNSWK